MFVRNLPYTCDDAGLEAAFGEIGPVKECFIIADKGSGGRSKGFGFVQFALAEDAAAAVARSKTFKVDGRPVTIDVAKQKPSSRGARSGKEAPADATGGGGGERARDDDGDDSDSDAPKIRSAPEPRNHDAFRASGANANPGGPRRPGGRGAVRPAHPALEDARAARTVALAGLRLAGEPGGIDPDAALDAARACGDVEEIISPAPNDVIGAAKLRHDGAARGVAFVVYGDEATAASAVAELHRTLPGVGKRKAQRVRAQLAEGGVAAVAEAKAGKNGPEGPEPVAELLWARQLGGCEGAKPKSWRVIIRNLAFKATDEDIRSACAKAGFVWDLTVPRDFHRKPKGFAFAAFTSKADAARAVAEVNGTAIAGRPVAVDWALSKHSYAEAQQKAAEMAEEEGSEGEEEDEEESGEEESGEEEEDSDDESEGSEGSEGSDESDESNESDESEEESESEGDDTPAPAPVPAEDEDADDMARRVMMRMMENPDAELNPAVAADSGKKMGSRKEAREAAKAARLAKLAETREAKAKAKAKMAGDDVAPPLPGAKRSDPPKEGASVFIRDLPVEVSKQTLYERMQKFGKVRSCRLVIDKATGRAKGTAFVDFHDPSAASRAVETATKEEGGGVKVAGRRLTITLAVSASEAASLAEKKAKEEGAGRTRRDGPRDNRNLYLANEGQVHEEGPAAKGVSQGDIMKRRRAKAEQAMKLKNPNFFISKTRLQVRNVPQDVDQKQLKALFLDAVRRRATQANPRVLHAKLLYDPTRPDAEGKPRSRGIGFVEFGEHEHALAALRALNNNPETFTTARRPIVEFAVEDARAVKKLARRREGLDKAQRERDAKRKEERAAAPGVGASEGKGKGKGRGKDRGKGNDEGAGAPSGGAEGGDRRRAREGGGEAGGGDGERGSAPAAKRRKRDAPAKGHGKKANAAGETHTDAKTKAVDRSAATKRPARDVFGGDDDVTNGGRRRGGEKRDKLDDLVDAYVGKGAAGGEKKQEGKTQKRLGRWFDY